MADLKPFEVIMKIDFGANDGVTAVVHAEKVAELVRCKDCKYHEDEEPGMVYCPNHVSGWVSEDFFCKDGERRSDE